MINRYLRLYSGPIYDVMSQMGYPNQVLSHEIKPLVRGMDSAGPALTLQSVDSVPGSVQRAESYFGALCKACTPGCVAVYSMGREQQAGHWGELTSTSVKAHGCQGVVIDGGVRDSDLIERLAFPAFCRYTSPIEMAARACFISCQKPVFMSGSLTTVVKVEPEDWVFADGDGVTIIPKNIASDVLREAETLAERECKGHKLFANGMGPGRRGTPLRRRMMGTARSDHRKRGSHASPRTLCSARSRKRGAKYQRQLHRRKTHTRGNPVH